jgi:hypothetical protein
MVDALGQELLALSRDHSFRFFTAFGLMFAGWAHATGEDTGEGLAMMRHGADLFRTVGQRVGLAHRAHLADVLIAHGLRDEALSVLDEAWRQSAETGERAFAAELRRLRGEALRRGARLEEAEDCVRDAVTIASGQGAWLFALRAASDLVQLAGARGSAAATDRDRLRAIVDRIPPGTGSSDLTRARTLLGDGP